MEIVTDPVYTIFKNWNYIRRCEKFHVHFNFPRRLFWGYFWNVRQMFSLAFTRRGLFKLVSWKLFESSGINGWKSLIWVLSKNCIKVGKCFQWLKTKANLDIVAISCQTFQAFKQKFCCVLKLRNEKAEKFHFILNRYQVFVDETISWQQCLTSCLIWQRGTINEVP